VSVHYRRPRLNRVLEGEEQRLGSGADSAAFHAGVLQLLRDHKNEVAVPVSGATERIVIAILRAVVDFGLVRRESTIHGASAMRATCIILAKRARCDFLLPQGCGPTSTSVIAGLAFAAASGSASINPCPRALVSSNHLKVNCRQAPSARFLLRRQEAFPDPASLTGPGSRP